MKICTTIQCIRHARVRKAALQSRLDPLNRESVNRCDDKSLRVIASASTVHWAKTPVTALRLAHLVHYSGCGPDVRRPPVTGRRHCVGPVLHRPRRAYPRRLRSSSAAPPDGGLLSRCVAGSEAMLFVIESEPCSSVTGRAAGRSTGRRRIELEGDKERRRHGETGYSRER